MTWVPLDSLLHARVVAPFLPLDHVGDSANFSNVYPGDECYVFEKKGEEWGRAYFVSKPVPSDFSTSAGTHKATGNMVSAGIVPLQVLRAIREIPIPKDSVLEISELLSGNLMSGVPSLLHTEMIHSDEERVAPALPSTSASHTTLMEDISASLSQLMTHAYTLYASGEFSLFEKLVETYDKLDDIRLRLTNELYTANERQRAYKEATFLLNSIPKVLSLKRTRIGGFDSVVARDEITGQLFKKDDALSPVTIAHSQLLAALSPNYPLALQKVVREPVKASLTKTPSCHILVDFKAVTGSSNILPKGYDGITAFMYLRNSRKRLTEAFAIEIKPDQSLELDNISAALFENIPATEVDSGKIYLVAVLTEQIKTDGIHLPDIRTGIAAGVSDISRIFSRKKGSLESGEAHQFQIKMFSSFRTADETSSVSTNKGWGELVDRIISGSSQGVAINPRAEKLVLSIKEFKSESIMPQVLESRTGDAPISAIRTMVYDPKIPVYERLYLKLNKVDPASPLMATSYVSVVLSTNSEHLHISKGANLPGKREWKFLTVGPREHVGETVQITGFDSRVSESVEYMTFKVYVNNEFYGQGKMNLRRGNRIPDYPRGTTLNLVGPNENIVGTLEFTSEYVGKYHNADPALQHILNWRALHQSNIQETEAQLVEALKKFNKVPLSSLIKFFPELLIDLTEMLRDASSHKLDGLSASVFESLVHFLDVVLVRQDQYFYLFEEFMEKYVKKLSSVGPELILMMRHVFAHATREWSHVGRALCRTSSLVLRLSAAATSKDSLSFGKNCTALLAAIKSFLSLEDINLAADQTLVMEDLEQWTENLRPFYTDKSLLAISIQWIEAVGTRGLDVKDDSSATALVLKKQAAQHNLLLTRLIVARRLLYSWMVTAPDCQVTLISSCIQWSLEILTAEPNFDALRLANGLLLSVCSTFIERKIYKDTTGELHRSIARLLPLLSKVFLRLNRKSKKLLVERRSFTQLFPCEYPFPELIMDSVVDSESFAEVLIELGVLIVIVSNVARENSFEQIFADSENDSLFKSDLVPSSLESDDLKVMLQCSSKLSEGPFFPRTKWISMHALFVECAVTMVELVKPVILKQTTNLDLVHLYIQQCLAISLSISDNLPETAQQAFGSISGDVRSRIVDSLKPLWDFLSVDATPEISERFQITKVGNSEFVTGKHSIIVNLMLFCLQKHDACQDLGVQMLWALIVNEWCTNGNLFEIEKNCITGLYESLQSGIQYSDTKDFIIKMKSTVRCDPDDAAFQPVTTLIRTLASFLEVLHDLRSVPLGDEFDDDRTFHNLNISGYLMQVNRPELLHSFIEQMSQANIRKGHFVQAALSVELLANTYEWSTETRLPAQGKFPAQTNFERKEALYKTMASNFVKGKCYENAIAVYQELVRAYENVSFDLKGLSYAHQQLAKVYAELDSVDRLIPTYFKVMFIGYGFPNSIRGREFIYEGLPFEHISSIHDRLSKQYPGTRMVTKEQDAQAMLEQTPFGRFMHVKTVTPQHNYDSISSMHLLDELNTFVSSKRLPGASGVTDLWTEETIYTTYFSFPTLMNRSEVKESSVVKISPLENAIRALVTKNEQLLSAEKAALASDSAFHDLSRELVGTVDSPVNGGVGQYRVFFDSEGDQERIAVLRKKFNDLVLILGRCLSLHANMVSSALLESHYTLVDMYNKNFADEIAALEITVESPPELTKTTTNTTEDSASMVSSTRQSSHKISWRTPGFPPVFV